MLDGTVTLPSQDASEFKEPPAIALQNLQNELELYCPGLTSRPSIVFINKADLIDKPQYVMDEIRELVGPDTPILVGSAKEGQDLEGLAINLRLVVEELMRRDAEDAAAHASTVVGDRRREAMAE